MEPIDVVLSFVNEMNDWEHKMYLVSRRENGQVINHASDRAILPEESYEDYKKKYYLIFKKYCTEKKRVYGGQPSGWARHGQYCGIGRDTVESVSPIKKNKVEVIVKGGQFPDHKFLFVLVSKHGAWKIDSAKWKAGEKWETHHL